MPDLHTLRAWVTIASLVMAIASFLIFLVAVSRRQNPPEKIEQATMALQARGLVPTVADIAELVKAVSGLGDTLAKAGPTILSLLASILFILMAAVGAGALEGSPPMPTAQTPDPKAETPPPANENLPVRSPGKSMNDIPRGPQVGRGSANLGSSGSR